MKRKKRYSIPRDSFLKNLPLKVSIFKVNDEYAFVRIYTIDKDPEARQSRCDWVEVGIKSKLRDMEDIDLINLHQASSNSISGSVNVN